MSLRAGTFLWFVAHDLRQTWRGFDAAVGGLTRGKVLALGVFAIALHIVFWLGLPHIGLNGRAAGEASLSPYVAIAALFVLPGVVAQAMTSSTRALYTRGDLDLLFASPVSASAVLAAKAFAIAINAIAWFAILLLPLANVNALAGHLHWLAIYPALAACGLFGTGVGIVLALGLFVATGPRRARLVSQIVATVVGASFMLGLQIYAAAPSNARESLMTALESPLSGDLLDWRLWVSLPARAADGELSALIRWIAVAIAVFLFATSVFGERFAMAAVVSAGAPTGPVNERRRRPFRANFGATIRSKERRLVLRDPWLVSQIILQVVYMLPISLILWRNGGVTGSPGVAFSPLIVVVGAQLAGSLAWLALSGEDAPDLLRAAPLTKMQIERYKLQAVLAPVALILCAPIGALALVSPWSAFCATLFTFGASVSTALLNLWRQAPSRRSKVLQRHSQSKIVGLIEHFLSIVWAVAVVIAVKGSWAALAPVFIACFVLWLSRSREPRVSLPATA